MYLFNCKISILLKDFIVKQKNYISKIDHIFFGLIFIIYDYY